VLCTTIVHSDMHTHEQFLKMSVGLGLGLVFVRLFTFSILCFFWFSLDYFVLVLAAFVVLGSVSPVLCHKIGWEERLQNDLFCKTLTQSINSFSALTLFVWWQDGHSARDKVVPERFGSLPEQREEVN